MTAKEMAQKMVGDGQSPNKYFVTVGPWYMPKNSEDLTLIFGFDKNMSETVVFDDKEKALEYYRDIELKFEDGVGHVMLEDRMVGVLCERFLHEPVTRMEEWVSDMFVEEEVSDMFVGL